ncbi:putative RNA-binding protein [Exophiala dermatitidis]
MGDKKRKGSSGATDLPPKKTKKSKGADVVADKPAASPAEVEPMSADNAPAAASKKSRKRAADFMNEEESTKAVAPTTASTAIEEPAVKKSKKSKKNKKSKEDQILTADGVNGVVEHPGDEDLETATAQKPANISMQAEAERTLDQELENDFRAVASEDEAGYVDEVEVEDNAAALLKGFDSDTEDKQEDTGLDLSTTPALPKSKKVQKKLDKIKAEGKDDGPGAVYVGRIPHGFYEKQMREYFSQFGDITRLRLSRNKRTGASKHFAFIEFASNEVAKIVAETMDNYLLFGHILKCKYAPPDSLHPDVWKGADKKYRKIPHEKLEREKLAAPKTADKWQKKVEKEQRKREEKAKKLKAIGVDMPASTLTNPADVVKDKLITAEEPKKAIEGSKPDTAEKEAKESKKEKKDKKDKKDKKNKDKTGNVEEEKAAPNQDAVSVEPEAAKAVESASAEKEAKPEASTETKADKSGPGVPLSKKERKALNKAETVPESEMTKEERKALRNARSKLAQAQAQAKTPKAGSDATGPSKPTEVAEQPSVEEEKVADAPADKKNETAPEPQPSKEDGKKAKKEKKEKKEKKKAKGSKEDETVARGEEEQPVKAVISADASKPTETEPEEQSAFATDADFVSFGDINNEEAQDGSESDAEAPEDTRATLSNASRGPTVPKGKAALKAYKKEKKEKKALKKKERRNLVKARGPKSGLVATNPKPAPLTVPGKIPGVPLLGKGKYDKVKRQAYKELKKNVLKRNILRKSKADQPATEA